MHLRPGPIEIPAGAHFNKDKPAKLGKFLENEVTTGKIPGAILLIQQHSKPVYHESFGVQDVVSKAPITDQTMFRLFSMTKAITSVLAVKMLDEGMFNQPGALWQYGHSTDVLARIMEIVSGKSLIEVEREKPLDPYERAQANESGLAAVRTRFSEKRARLLTSRFEKRPLRCRVRIIRLGRKRKMDERNTTSAGIWPCAVGWASTRSSICGRSAVVPRRLRADAYHVRMDLLERREPA